MSRALILLLCLLAGPAWAQSPQSGPSTVFVGSSYTNATTTFTSVPNLYYPVTAGANYIGLCDIIWQGSAVTTGAKYQWTGPGSPSAVAAGASFGITALTSGTAAVTAFSSAMANTGTITTATNFHDTVSVNLMNGSTAGVVQLQAAANGVGTLTIQPASSCTFTPMR
jgi:hypothetical protein